jgi:hypothetical protein
MHGFEDEDRRVAIEGELVEAGVVEAVLSRVAAAGGLDEWHGLTPGGSAGVESPRSVTRRGRL